MDYFRQTTTVSRRPDSVTSQLEGWMGDNNRQLHVGCADWPIYDPETSLQLKWIQLGRIMDGLDVPQSADILDDMNLRTPAELGVRYFTSISPELLSFYYDALIIPETIEHVGNVEEFLGGLSTINAGRFAITTPNGLFRGYESYMHEGVVYEEIHPDHNCWFTPFTLCNVIRKYTPWEIIEVLITSQDRTLLVVGRCR